MKILSTILLISFLFCHFQLIVIATSSDILEDLNDELEVSTNELDISAQAYVLMEASTGEVILSKNENEQLSMASTTKIMTTLLALEQDDIYEKFVVDSQAIQVEGSSMGLKEGDIVDLYTLSVGMLLPSGNDASNAVAVRVAGNYVDFATLMNERAYEIGMENTNFVTASGLDDDVHYSTAYDMALLAREATNNPLFMEICSQSEITVSFGNPPYDRTLSNHNKLLTTYEGAIGMKTGYTRKSGRCLVSVAQRDGVQLIVVTLNDPNDWADHEALLDYGFANVKPVEIVANVSKIVANVVGGQKDILTIESDKQVFSCVDLNLLEEEIILEKFYYAPINKGDIIGEIRHIYNERVIAKTILLANETIDVIEEINEKKSLIQNLIQWSKNAISFNRIIKN